MSWHPIQLFDKESSTYTYIIAAENDGKAAIIDPVNKQWERDLKQLERLGLTLSLIFETHAHADHITSSGRLAQITGARTAAPQACGICAADIQLKDDDTIKLGDDYLRAIHTPGHTAGSMCFLWRNHVFTGDTLLINGCGRTDFQGGSAQALYKSINEKLFELPEDTLVWPGHDYNGQSVSTILWEKSNNHRLANRDENNFIHLMHNLELQKPRLIDVAVPANQNLGLSRTS